MTVFEMRINNRPRIIAAVLYLIAALFFGGIISILVAIGGKEGVSILLSPESAARPAVIYMVEAGLFSLTISILLFCPVSLSRSNRLVILVCAILVALIGMFFAPISLIATIVPVWFLHKLHRDETPWGHDQAL